MSGAQGGFRESLVSLCYTKNILEMDDFIYHVFSHAATNIGDRSWLTCRFPRLPEPVGSGAAAQRQRDAQPNEAKGRRQAPLPWPPAASPKENGTDMTSPNDWKSAAAISTAAFREATAHLEPAIAEIAKQMPPLEVRMRGGVPIHRYSEKSVDVALALKLIQLRGNIRAGELLIREGLFLEWDVVQRSMHDALEDSTLLAAPDQENKVVRRYIAFFFDEDLDKNGELTKRGDVGVGRQEIRSAIGTLAQSHGHSPNDFAQQSRELHRVRSGSVHGRGASIMRAYFEETAPRGLWLGGDREPRRTAWELVSLRLMTSHVLSTFGLAGVGRWWEPATSLELMDLGQRLRDAVDGEIAALKAVGWESMGNAE